MERKIGDIAIGKDSWRRRPIQKQYKQTSNQPKYLPQSNIGNDWVDNEEVVIQIPEFIQWNADEIDVLKHMNFSIELEGSSMGFGRDLEEYIEHQLEEMLTETLSSACFHCETKKMYDGNEDEYYCPLCDT